MDFITMKNLMQASASAALAIAAPTSTYAPYEKMPDASNVMQKKHANASLDGFIHIDNWRKASSQFVAAAHEATQRFSSLQQQNAEPALHNSLNGIEKTDGALVPSHAINKLSNLEHFQLGLQFEAEGNFSTACMYYSLAIAEGTSSVSTGSSAAASDASNASSGDVYLTYTTKLAIRKRVKWLEWLQETDVPKKKMLGLQYIHLLYMCRSDKLNANDDLLGASYCLNSMGLLDEAKSCYEHYVNGAFEPSDKILTQCCAVSNDQLQSMVENFQLNLDGFQVTTAIDHEGMLASADDSGNDADSDNSITCRPTTTTKLKKQQSKTKRSGSHTVSSSSESSTSSGKDEQTCSSRTHERSQPDTELGFDATACLLPLTPRRTVLSLDDAHSNKLRHFCYSHPVAVLRDMHAALNMNLVNYSTKAIVDVDPDCPIEERTQLYQPGDMNLDLNTMKPSWDYYSEAGSTTVKNIALYQLQTFLQQNRTAKTRQVGQPIHFGTNLDLSDTVKWHAQLDELDKLPSFLRVTTETNMLSYIDYELLGVNTVQMYIKVGGNRTPGHQENNNFCSVNVNIGPGDCEWFCVDFEHWERVRDLCQKNELDFLKDAWWPFTDDLTRAGVPVYKFIQKPGDVVWVNIGTVHWVQALSVCNNIAWNVGPLTAYQLKVGIERYEYNRIARFQSIIPMTYLIWSLSQSGADVVNRNGGAKLFTMLKTLMRQSLEHCQLQLRMLECVFKKEVHLCDPAKIASNKRAQYCWRCESEVYNILYCLRKQKPRGKIELETHCYRCAIADDANLTTYTIMQQYDLKHLCTSYEKFCFDFGGGKNSIALAIGGGNVEKNLDVCAIAPIVATPSSVLSSTAAPPKQLFDAALQYPQQQPVMMPVEHSTLLKSRLAALAATSAEKSSSFLPTKKQRTNNSPMRRSSAKVPICLPPPPTELTNGQYSSVDTNSQPTITSSKNGVVTNNNPVIRSSNGSLQTNKRTFETICREYSMLQNDADDDENDETAITAEMDGWHAKQTAAAEKRAAKGVVVQKQPRTKSVVVKSQCSSTPDVLLANSSSVSDDRASAEYSSADIDLRSSLVADGLVDKTDNNRQKVSTPPRRSKQPSSRKRKQRDHDDAADDSVDDETTVDSSGRPSTAKTQQKTATTKRQYKRKRPNNADDNDIDADATAHG